eukprot:m.41631 g.41631  ORF g.41631 m.41631 type:complete len:178 (+) comp11844_c0_seq3:1098-1631(+)
MQPTASKSCFPDPEASCPPAKCPDPFGLYDMRRASQRYLGFVGICRKTCEALRTDLESARQAMNCEQAQATQTRQEIDKAHKEAVASIRSLEQLLAVRQDEIAELKALASQDKSDNVNAQQELQAKSSQLQELEEVISDLSEAVKQKHLRSSIIKPCRQLTQQPEHKFSSDTIFTNI